MASASSPAGRLATSSRITRSSATSVSSGTRCARSDARRSRRALSRIRPSTNSTSAGTASARRARGRSLRCSPQTSRSRTSTSHTTVSTRGRAARLSSRADPPTRRRSRRRETPPRAPSVHAGALALAEGIRANNALHQLELSHNPLCRVVDGVAKKEGLKALVDAMRLNQNLARWA